MSDRLTLSDLQSDAKADQVARVLDLSQARKRIRELQQGNAALETLLAEQERLKTPKAAGNKIGARKNANFKAVSTAPSINNTPRGSSMVAVAYPTTQDLSNSCGVAKSVRFNGDPAYLQDSSKQSSCKGDDQGTGGGVRSGTVNGEVKPVQGSSTVRIEGKQVIRQGDPCTMNGGNNPGIYTTTESPSGARPKDAIETSNPPIKLETPEEISVFERLLDKVEEVIGQAQAHPVEAGIGAIKGYANALPNLGVLLLKLSAEMQASALEQNSLLLDELGMEEESTSERDVAAAMRDFGRRFELPTFTMSNEAQESGNTIATTIQLFSGSFGVLKGGVSWIKGLRNTGKLESANVNNFSAISKDTPSKPVADITVPSNGIKIVSRKNDPNSLKYKPSSGANLTAKKDATTTILGSYTNDMAAIVQELGNVKSLDLGARLGSFNVLNIPDNLYVAPAQFWSDFNLPWLSNAMSRGDAFLIATRPAFEVADVKSGFSVLARPNPLTGKMELSGFGREYLEMRRAGYVYENGAMRK